MTAIAHALGVREFGEQSPSQAVHGLLETRRLLLLLDNFEHVLAGARDVAELLTTCAHLKVLATSREALRLRWEHVFPVGALDVPDQNRLPNLIELERIASVALFVERAQAANPSFVLSAANAQATAVLTAGLDGLPLAIELAAARSASLSLGTLTRRLNERLNLFEGARDAADRHLTLRAMVSWSHDLLSAHEKSIFARLSVFSGGATADSVREVGGLADTAEIVEQLVHKNLVRVSAAQDSEIRFSMLDTIRLYALECLQASDDEHTIRGRHARHFLEIAEQARQHWRGSDQGVWVRRLEREVSNLHAVLAWCFDTGLTELALRMASALSRFWDSRRYLSEGHTWLERALPLSVDADPVLRVKVLLAAATIASRRGTYERAQTLGTQALELARTTGDDDLVAESLRLLGVNVGRGWFDFNEAQRWFTESLEVRRRYGDASSVATGLFDLGRVALDMRDYPRARELLEESLVLARSVGDALGSAYAALDLARLKLATGDVRSSLALSRDALGQSRDLGEQEMVAACLDQFAAVLAHRRDAPAAARLLGAAQAIRGEVRYAANPSLRELDESSAERVRSMLGSHRMAEAIEEGRLLNEESAVAFAMRATSRI
jgi:non-specific serine/threonine protein kinase